MTVDPANARREADPKPGQVIQFLVDAWACTFLVAVFFVLLVFLIFLISREDPIWFSRWKGLIGLSILAISGVALMIRSRIGGQFELFLTFALLGMCGMCLVYLPTPTNRYASIWIEGPDEFPGHSEIYHRWSPIVRDLEAFGPFRSRDGRRYKLRDGHLFSPRVGMLLGSSPGEGDGAPPISSQTSGIAAWLFGIRVASEVFVCFTIHLTPLFLLYVWYCKQRRKPMEPLLRIEPIRALFLLGPFCLGLIPLLGI